MENLKILVKWFIFYITGITTGKFISCNFIYFSCLIGFLIGFLLRFFHIYPGKEEPLILDFSTFILSAVIILISLYYRKIDIRLGLFLIFFPHILYNILMLFKNQ